ncbi:MAG: response regulator [Deltaproteobacteria bacterium]
MLEREIVTRKNTPTTPVLKKKKEVLVVDDNKTVQDVISRLLTFLDYHVTLADNGLEGGALFFTGNYDLVITDFHMPQMNGLQLSRQIKERSPKTPVIVVTGFTDAKDCAALNTNCVDAVIRKPFTLKDFESTVQRVLNP